MKQKDNIEKLILNNLDAFNNVEPPVGHFHRFEERLKKKNIGRRKSIVKIMGRVAAVVIFVLLVANQSVIWFLKKDSEEISMPVNTSLASVSPEYKEVEFFYTNAINIEWEQWTKMVGEGMISEEERLMMDNEMKEFEVVFKKLQNDLAINPNNERVINAMIDYYNTKLSLINMIVEKLQDVTHKNNVNHEKKI